MVTSADKTKEDIGRTLINLKRPEVSKVLPEYFAEAYPKLETLFNAYYDFMDSDANPDGYLHQLYLTRDATQVPEPLLQFLEDELLLGQAYFGGFINKREAIKYSNLLYRSKGTKFAIEQFFRSFFGVDVQVTYPKDQIFLVGPSIDYDQSSTNEAGEQIKIEGSKLGPESRKYITDDKLYQIYSVLIRSGISIKQWQDVYKLFVHPAGMYLGSELLIELVNNNPINYIQVDAGEIIPEFLAISAQATMTASAFEQTSLISQQDDVMINGIRMSTESLYYNIGSELTIDSADVGSIAQIISPNSFSFDDSDGTLFSFDSSNGTLFTKPTFDQHKYDTSYDSSI